MAAARHGFAVAVARFIFVIYDLLHSAARADGEGFQLDLHHRDAVDEQNHIITMETVVGVNAQLIDHLKAVLAPVLDIDKQRKLNHLKDGWLKLDMSVFRKFRTQR